MLQADECFVDPDIGRARTLPAGAFTDPEFLERELATIFSRCWLPLPQPEQDLPDLVRLRGSYAPVNLLGRPLFLQRDWEGKLRCLPNVCTHAWFPLVHGPGRERTIVCRQHGRRFDSAGRYIGQPGFEGIPPCQDDHLKALPVAEWRRLIFAALGEPAPPFGEVMREVDDSLACLPLDRLERQPMAGEVREVEGNWKQHAWNYMDVFHLAYIHRAPGGLADAIDLGSYQTELYAHSALQWAYAANPDYGFEPDLLPAHFRHLQRRVFALWWFIFPNLTLNFYPWGLSVNVYMPQPNRPDRTLFLWYHYVLDRERYARREEVWLNRQVDAEDVDAMRQVSRGLASGLAPRGRFAPKEETGPHWFHRLVYTSVFGS
ncbi:MAG TPA: SRPBCC family protein [Chloroflexota bacterium]|nr:SRPBCC family protein [Chloroflexota bacterium]